MSAAERPVQDRPRLLLHVGTQKTGTTTIQGFLKNTTEPLAAAGVHYLNTGRTNIAHNVMIQMIRKGRGPGLAKRLINEMGRHPDKTCVISSEMFFRKDMADYFAEHFPQEIRENTKIVIYLRRQDKFAEAMWKQRVKNGRYTGSPLDYMGSNKNLNYLPTLNHFANVFGKENLIVRPFERDHFPDGDVLLDFAGHCHLPLDLAKSYDVPSSNATLSKEVSQGLGRLNRDNSGINTKDIIRTLSRLRPEGAIRSGDCYDLSTRRAVMKEFAETNAMIREAYCPDLTALFDLSDLDDDTAYAQPSEDEQQLRARQANDAIAIAMEDMGVS